MLVKITANCCFPVSLSNRAKNRKHFHAAGDFLHTRFFFFGENPWDCIKTIIIIIITIIIIIIIIIFNSYSAHIL